MPAQGHFRLLDGLRGVAAISVVAYHFAGRAGLPSLLPRGYLAVDFFFVLSGFVLAHAYAERLRTSLSAPTFFLMRLVRLLPMLIPGTLFGAVLEFWRPDVGATLRHLGEVSFALVLGCVALPWPFPTTMEQTIFPINGPVWSLFFELVANTVFVIVAKGLFPRLAFVVLAIAGAIGVLACAVALERVDVGPLITDWPGGLPRVTFSFFAGAWLNTARLRFPPLPAWTFPCVLVGIFFVPLFSNYLSVVFDVFIVLCVFPVMVGSALRSSPPSRFLRACDLSGEISYPIYAIHYPVVRGICFVASRSHLAVAPRIGLATVGVLVICAISWFALIFYDRPFRRWLGQRLLVPRVNAASKGSGRLDVTRRWA